MKGKGGKACIAAMALSVAIGTLSVGMQTAEAGGGMKMEVIRQISGKILMDLGIGLRKTDT